MKGAVRRLFKWGGLSGVLLGTIGFSTACVEQREMYGPGPASFSVKIKVTDQSSTPLKGIKVSQYNTAQQTDPTQIYISSDEGEVYGKVYQVETIRFRFEDVDEWEGGGKFADTTVVIPIPSNVIELDYTMKMRKVADKK